MAVSSQGLAIPAFFGVDADWARIEAAGGAVTIVVPDLSFNTLTGDGLASAQAQFDRCRQGGQLILGYVDTGSGKRDPNAINADIARWYASYPTQIDGLFFDEGPELDLGNDQDFQDFYKGLIQSVKASHPGRSTILLNAAAFPNEWVVQPGGADFVILWEQTKDVYFNNYRAIGDGGLSVDPPAWWSDPRYAARIVHVVHTCPAADLPQVVGLSKIRGAGLIYIFDGTSSGYSRLPSYWDEELAEASASFLLALGPAVSSWAAGRLDIFSEGMDGALWHRWFQDPGGWSGWESLGGALTSAPAAVSWGNGRIDVFARGAGSDLLHRWFQDPGGWSGWESLGGALTSDPAAVSWGDGRIDVFARGPGYALWHRWFDNGWSVWEQL